MNASVKLDHESVGDGGWLVRALLRIHGDARPARGRMPLNLSLVLDRSGSMAGEKLAAVKRAAVLLAKHLDPADVLSVVTYDDEVTVIEPPGRGADQPGFASRIESIRSGGSTNLSGGWLQGRRFVDREATEGAVNRVLLLTDGLANVGITDPTRLVGLCREAAAAGVTTTTIGFGTGYDEHLLSAMADAGGGGAYYIEQPDQAPAVLAEELRGLVSMAAQNVTVEITGSDAVESCCVLHTYPSSLEGGVLSLAIGDLYAREPRPVLAEFLMKPPAGDTVDVENGAGDIPVGTFVILGDVLTADGGVEQREVLVPIRLSPVEGGFAEPEVRRMLTLLEAARERERALEARTAEERQQARERLHLAALRVRGLDPDDAVIREEASDLHRMSERVVRALDDQDLKYHRYRARYAGRGRADAIHTLSRERWEETREPGRRGDA